MNAVAHTLTPDDMAKAEKASKVQLGTYVSEDLYGQLQDYHDDTGIPITRIVEDALSRYLAQAYRVGHVREDEPPHARKKRRGAK